MSTEKLITKTQKTLLIVIPFIIGIIVGSFYMWEDVPNEKIIINQFPFSGEVVAWTAPGFQLQMFGTTTEYYKTNQVRFDEIERKGDDWSTINLINPALPITFADKGKGWIVGNVRVELPLNQDQLKLIQSHYGSERRLIQELIVPSIKKVITASGPLMTSLESVAEKKNDLNMYIVDQLNNGIYQTEVITRMRKNIITGEDEKYQQAQIAYNEFNNAKRAEKSPFTKYGVSVTYFGVQDIKYEKSTEGQIAKQKESEMDIITSKTNAAQAVQRTIQVEQEGLQKAANAKWEQEAIKAKEVVAAQQALEVATLKAKTSIENAKQVKAEAEAEAFRQQALVKAGLSPKEKAEFEMNTAIGVAKALADSKVKWVPEIIYVSGGNQRENNAMDAVGLKMMLDITKSMSDSK